MAKHRAGELVSLRNSGLDTAKAMARYWARVVYEIENGIPPVTADVWKCDFPGCTIKERHGHPQAETEVKS